MHQFITILILIFFLVPTPSQQILENGDGFIFDLINRDSTLSPLYNHSIPSFEVMRDAGMRSLQRARFMHSSITMGLDDEKEEVVATLVPSSLGEFLMKFYIGSPPVEILGFLDTGSDLIWVPCFSSNLEGNHPSDVELFYPKRSSTYKKVSYYTHFCRSIQQRFIDHEGDYCNYVYGYLDGSNSRGVLSNETIYLNSSTNGEVIPFPKVIFGCDHTNIHRDEGDKIYQGVIGLGNGLLSLISQLKHTVGYKFSYCLLPHGSNGTSKLRLGAKETISGPEVVSTPLINVEHSRTHYYVSLESVGIADQQFKLFPSEANIIIDSGTTLTMLPRNTYKDLEAAIIDKIGLKPMANPLPSYEMCYELDSIRNKMLPDIFFHYDKNASVRLEAANIFEFGSEVTCLAIVPSDRFFILGWMAQVNFEVQFDVLEKQVYFLPKQCSSYSI